MKILYDHQAFCIQKYGGVSRYCIELVQKLSSYDRLNILVFAPLHRNLLLKNVKEKHVYNPFFIPNFKFVGFLTLFINAFLLCIYSRLKTIDILHSTYFFSFFPIKAKFHVITVYDMIHEIFPKQVSLLDFSRYFKKKAVINCDHIITISENTRNDIINYYRISPKKITSIYLGIKNSIFDKKVSLDFKFILFVGNRTGYKNFSNLLYAYNGSSFLSNNFKLVCFGGSIFSNEEVSLFKFLGLSDHVLFVTGDDGLLNQYYMQASVFVYPSLYEGFGFPPLEAMRCGCPVVASNKSSIPEVVGDAAFLCEPHSVSSIQNAIIKVLKNNKIRNELIVKGFKNISNYKWSECASRTLDVYNTLIK